MNICSCVQRHAGQGKHSQVDICCVVLRSFVVRLSALLIPLQLLGLPQLIATWRGESDGGCNERCADFDASEEAPRSSVSPLAPVPTRAVQHFRVHAWVIALLASGVVDVVLPQVDQLPAAPDLEDVFRPSPHRSDGPKSLAADLVGPPSASFIQVTSQGGSKMSLFLRTARTYALLAWFMGRGRPRNLRHAEPCGPVLSSIK